MPKGNRVAQYESFIQNAPMAVAMLDTDMNYIAVSERWYEQYDLDEEMQLIGKNHYEVFPKIKEMPEWLEVHKKSLQGEHFREDEELFIGEDGSEQYLRWAVHPWYARDNTIGGILIYTEDITEGVIARKKAATQKEELEKKVKNRTQKLEQVNKDLEAFSYSVSHDLRTPLRAITGFSQILHDEHAENLGEEGQRLLNVIIDNTEKMATLIDDILAFSRVSRADLVRTKVDIEQLFNTAIKTVAEGYPELEDKLEIEVEDLPEANGDISLLRQVAVNLISNAFKYSSNNETVKVKVGFTEDNGTIIYFVRDNGVGFDMKYEDKLFGVFERLHSSADFEGTGVGLSLVNRIIKQHKGKIWAESEPGNGATFFFHL